jgi:hypothetical protein
MEMISVGLIKSFCRGSRGAVFSKRAPLAAGGTGDLIHFLAIVFILGNL